MSLGSATPAEATHIRVDPVSDTPPAIDWERVKQIVYEAEPNSPCVGQIQIQLTLTPPPDVAGAAGWVRAKGQGPCDMGILDGREPAAMCSTAVHEGKHLGGFYDPVGVNGDHLHSPDPNSIMFPTESVEWPACRVFRAPEPTWTQDALATEAFYRGIGRRNWFARCNGISNGRRRCIMRRKDNGRLIGKFRIGVRTKTKRLK